MSSISERAHSHNRTDVRCGVQKVRPLAVLSAAALILSLPIFLFGFPILAHDGRGVLLLLRHFSLQFWSGDLYPRWLMGTYHGFGSPTFFIYGPLPFFFECMMAPFAGRAPGSFALSLSAVMALWLSGLAAYLWLRRFCAPSAAISKNASGGSRSSASGKSSA